MSEYSNKRVNYNYYIISQCIVMLNCFLCCLEIYPSKLVNYSYILIGIAIVFYLLSKVYINFKFTLVNASFLVLFGYMILTDIINSNFTSFVCLMDLSSFILFFVFSFSGNSKENTKRSIFILLVVCVICSTLISIASIFVFINKPPKIDLLSGVTGNRNILAAYTIVGVISSLALLIINTRKKGLLIISLIINLYTLFTTKSRTPLTVLTVFLIVMLMYYFFENSKEKNKKLSLFGFIILSIIILTCSLTFIINRNNVSFTSQSLKNIINKISSNRLEIWTVCFQIIKNNPIFGVSNNAYQEIMMNALNFPGNQHNVYISLMTLNGIPSLLIYLFIICFTLISSIITIKELERNEEKRMIFLYLAILFGFLVGDNFECNTFRSYIPISYIVFLMYSALDNERVYIKEREINFEPK